MIAEKAAKVLNKFLKADPEAASAWVENRVPVVPGLASSAFEIIASAENGILSVGGLGVLNGIIRAIEGPDAEIVVAYYNTGDFETVKAFTAYRSPT